MKSFDWRRGIIFPLISISLTFLLVEVVVRLLVRPSTASFGRLGNIELPPVKFLPKLRPDNWLDSKKLTSFRTIDNQIIAKDDVAGRFRIDDELGYLPEENTRSTNGWWIANSFGARSDYDHLPYPPKGKRRILLLGESYTHGYGLQQNQTWGYQLQQGNPAIETVNLGSSGYGMGQALLRYEIIRKKLRYDAVIFLFLPGINLWRDVNSLRFLGERWQSYTLNPRFILKDNVLEVVRGPYRPLDQVFERNADRIDPALLEFLSRYDRFFVPLYYHPPQVLGSFWLVKLVGVLQWKLRLRELKNPVNSFKPDSEAVQVVSKIFERAERNARQDNAKLFVAFLPTFDEMKQMQDGRSNLRNQWSALQSIVRSQGINTIDLLPFLESLPPSDLDYSCDGTHIGPKTSVALAKYLGERLGF